MRLAGLAACAFAISCAGQAAGWCDPEWGPCDDPPTPKASEAPSLAEQAEALGLHAVTTVKVTDVRSTQGDTTTYSTATAHEVAGTFATKVESVGTGDASQYDRLASGERMTTSDGRGVAGDYYANYVVRGDRLVFDRFVFFADDSETARRSAPATPAPIAPETPPAAEASARPVSPVDTVGLPPTPGTTPPAAPRPGDGSPQTPPPPSDRPRAGMALEPAGDVLGSIEVLRGRRVELWVRASVRGRPARVTAWRFLGGELVALGPLSGAGDEPLVATWRTLSGSDPYRIRVRATVRVPGQGERDVTATIDVIVRSPAIVQ